ncbi:uncharacterized protein LOC106169882 isoform X2 [Lingula anatina]|nr:uncharacterized protein LOC106169882 isoform X2 [Lingula anatina]|eukprot:XP_023930355.1 uncharacterized protein LOC106169882 isoform X2 [Lingula anatina]
MDWMFEPNQLYQFVLVVNNSYGQLEVQHRLDVGKLIKPSKVLNLKAVSGSRKISLTWEKPQMELATLLSFNFRISYTGHANWLPRTSHVLTVNTTSVVIRNLFPAVRYTILVIAVPSCGGYDSDEAILSAVTLDEAPTEPPVVNSGSYSNTRCGAKCRHITFFWKRMEEQYTNRIIRYTLELYPGNITLKVFGSGAQATVKHLSTELHYTVLLKAWTKAGPSPQASWAVLPLRRNSLHLKNIASMLKNGSVMLRWSPTVGNVTVYWCRGGADHMCKEEMSWATLPASRGHYEVPLDTKVPDDILYAASLERAGRSAGLQWTDCLYHYMAVPSSSPQLKVWGSHMPGQLYLEWKLPSCQELGHAQLTGYNLQYGIKDRSMCDLTKWTTVKVLSELTTSYILRGLSPKQSYCVRIQAVSEAGKGPFSRPPQKAMTMGLTNSEIGGLAGGTIVAITMVGIGIYSCFRYWHHCFKYVYSKIVITLPDDPIEPVELCLKENEVASPFYLSQEDNTKYFLLDRKQIRPDSGCGIPSSPDLLKEKMFDFDDATINSDSVFFAFTLKNAEQGKCNKEKASFDGEMKKYGQDSENPALQVIRQTSVDSGHVSEETFPSRQNSTYGIPYHVYSKESSSSGNPDTLMVVEAKSDENINDLNSDQFDESNKQLISNTRAEAAVNESIPTKAHNDYYSKFAFKPELTLALGQTVQKIKKDEETQICEDPLQQLPLINYKKSAHVHVCSQTLLHEEDMNTNGKSQQSCYLEGQALPPVTVTSYIQLEELQ